MSDNSIEIIGGGLAGMAMALSLHRQGLDSRIRDIRPRGAAIQDKRILALSDGSRQILETLGVWQTIHYTPIETIHVSQLGGFGRTKISAAEEKVAALGYVIAAGELAAALDRAIRAADIEYKDQAEAPKANTAALSIHAEGQVDEKADIKSQDYDQHAVICQVSASTPHRNIAWERFTPAGPVALLPNDDNYAVVLTCPSADSQGIAALNDADFIALLQSRFAQRIVFTAATARFVFPLGLRMRRNPVASREVWIGNAAQTLHPVAGQGFNLALRDISELADTLADASMAGLDDPGAAEVLARYRARRRCDRSAAARFTDTLVRLFSNQLAPLRHARGLGLLALDLLPPARSFLARRMMLGARGW